MGIKCNLPFGKFFHRHSDRAFVLQIHHTKSLRLAVGSIFEKLDIGHVGDADIGQCTDHILVGCPLGVGRSVNHVSSNSSGSLTHVSPPTYIDGFRPDWCPVLGPLWLLLP